MAARRDSRLTHACTAADKRTGVATFPIQADAVSPDALRHALLDAAIDAVVVADEDGRIVEWNPAATATFGLPRDVVVGQSFEETDHPGAAARGVPPGIRDERRQRRDRIGSEPGSSSSASAPTAREFPVEVAITRIEGDQVFFVSHLRDISVRRERDQELAEASRSLEEAERRHRTLLENLPSITYRAGLGYAGGWEYISPQVEEVLGYTPEGVDGRSRPLGARHASRRPRPGDRRGGPLRR